MLHPYRVCAFCDAVDETFPFWDEREGACVAECAGVLIGRTCVPCSEATLNEPYFDATSGRCVSFKEAPMSAGDFWDPKQQACVQTCQTSAHML